jgi:hypothetical protein
MPTSPDPDERDLRALRSLRADPGDTDAADGADPGLARLGAVARSLTDDDLVLTPPPVAVWDRVAAATTATTATTATGDEGAGTGGGAVGAWRHPTGWWWAAAAAIVVVLGIGAVATARTGDDDTVVARAELEPLTPAGGTTPTTARLVETGDGLRLEVAVADADLPPADGFHEVWLLDPEAAGMVSLGPLRTDERYQLPPNVDYHDFPVVDISAEPTDGDPTHSGASLLRGTLS